MRRASVLVLALTAALVAARTAVAATLTTDAPCYQASRARDIVISGTGYAPMGPVAISRDGRPFGTASADAAGSFQVKFPSHELGRLDREQIFRLSASDLAATSAMARYRTSRVFADFSPDTGDPQTLQVRFKVNGFGLAQPKATVYLHYVSPSGKLRRDVRLGTTIGDCGKIRETRLRHLFAFPAERGRWVLQFDTNKTYERATTKSKYTWVRKPVEVFQK